jgi:hypothetical protein
VKTSDGSSELSARSVTEVASILVSPVPAPSQVDALGLIRSYQSTGVEAEQLGQIGEAISAHGARGVHLGRRRHSVQSHKLSWQAPDSERAVA